MRSLLGSFAPARRPLRALFFCSIALVAALGPGCRSARPNTARDPITTPTEPAYVHPEPEPTPAWVGQPLSWNKLKEIEAWLAHQSMDHRGFWTVEGEFQIAQGRFEFARRDLSKGASGGTTAATTPQGRLRAARAALERLANDSAATEDQKHRAATLVARADQLLAGGRATPANSLAGVGILGRAAWSAAPARTERMERTRGGYRKITVHHSAEERAPELDGSVADTAAALRLMQRSHMESKTPRWGDIGYHYLIDPAGHVFQGRELAWQGAHADGDNNVQNVGVCLIGNFDEERPTKAALESLRKLLDALRKTYSIPRNAVHSHRDLKSTRCPGKYLEPWVENYAR